MRPKSQQHALTRISEVEIGLEESAVVLVEAGEVMGYLISEAYAVGGLPTEFILRNATYLCIRGAEIRIAESPEVLVSAKDGCWCAVETVEAAIIPCPAKEPYPVIFISKHGFLWMMDSIREGKIHQVIGHLGNRFDSSGFVTNRKMLDDPTSPFRRAARIATVAVIPKDEP